MGITELEEERRRYNPIVAAKLDEFLAKLQEYQDGKVLPFTFEVYDPSGNSFIQNPFAPKIDENLSCTYFQRSLNDYQIMGYPVNEAELMIEQDNLHKAGISQESIMKRESSKAVT